MSRKCRDCEGKPRKKTSPLFLVAVLVILFIVYLFQEGLPGAKKEELPEESPVSIVETETFAEKAG